MSKGLFEQSTIEECRALLAPLIAKLTELDASTRMDALNAVRQALHEISPMRREPVDCVLWIEAEKIRSNDYNPNSVAAPEMELLKLSILADGYTQPIVAWPDEGDTYEIVDGFHRNRIGREAQGVRRRTAARLPVAVINAERSRKEDRIAATIRHNRARGKHRVDAMSDIVLDLKRRNWSDEKIARELGMDADEVLRLAQISGIAALFADREFSEAWDAI